jgi:hypothetical protein
VLSSQLGPTLLRAALLRLAAGAVAQPVIPTATLPLDPVPVTTGVLGTELPPIDAYEVTLGLTTRSTLPSNYLDLQQAAATTTAFVPPTGFSPRDVLVLALAFVGGVLLVAWEIAEETEWTT